MGCDIYQDIFRSSHYSVVHEVDATRHHFRAFSKTRGLSFCAGGVPPSLHRFRNIKPINDASEADATKKRSQCTIIFNLALTQAFNHVTPHASHDAT